MTEQQREQIRRQAEEACPYSDLGTNHVGYRRHNVKRIYWIAGYTASQWVSVEDRLPERLEWVLAYCAEGNGRPGEYGVAMRDREGDGWHDGYGHWFMTPTHWSLLQEPARKK